MFELFVRLGIPIFGMFVALWISALIIKKKYPVQKWHGWLGMVISIGIVFFAAEFLRKTAFHFPFIATAMILLVFSLAAIIAAKRR